MASFRPPGSKDPEISLFRKIACVPALAAALCAGLGATPAVASPPLPLRARIAQAGRRLVLSVHTSRPVALGRLERLPRGRRSPYLCFDLHPAGRRGSRRLCIGGGNERSDRAGLLLLNAAAETTARREVVARLRRPEPEKLVLALVPAAAGLSPGRYGWRVLAQGDCGASTCHATLPSGGRRHFRLRPVRAVGCTGGGAGLVANGPRDRDVVALTFDDGPSEYTPAFLDVLREKHVPGTFFEVGQEMARYPQAMRAIVRQGDEIGNHTTHHTELPGYGDIAPTTALAARITHFRPCLFRPPGGAVDAAVIGAAGADGLLSVTWDVDPADWSTPGSAAIYSRVVDATRPGSIILMHDGGGPRGETLAALPQIIDTLRARGYRFATVSALLGDRVIYQPYG